LNDNASRSDAVAAAQIKKVFKRMETDYEFRARLGIERKTEYWGEGLDNYAWTYHRAQRRIVDDFA
jgi:hypothetical protein